MKTNQFTAEQVIKAIQNSRGIKSAIARQLGCSRRTVDNYIEKYVTVKEAYEEERAALVDIAELQLMKHVNAGSLAALFFVLKTIGKDRGYVERFEFSGSIKVEIINQLATLLKEQGHDPASVFNDMIAELMKQNVDSD